MSRYRELADYLESVAKDCRQIDDTLQRVENIGDEIAKLLSGETSLPEPPLPETMRKKGGLTMVNPKPEKKKGRPTPETRAHNLLVEYLEIHDGETFDPEKASDWIAEQDDELDFDTVEDVTQEYYLNLEDEPTSSFEQEV